MLQYRLMTPRRRALLTTLTFLLGAAAVTVFLWSRRPSDWQLSFWTTFAAGFQSEKYGHLVEHAAENMMAVIIMVSTLGGLLIAAGVRKTLRPPMNADERR